MGVPARKYFASMHLMAAQIGAMGFSRMIRQKTHPVVARLPKGLSRRDLPSKLRNRQRSLGKHGDPGARTEGIGSGARLQAECPSASAGGRWTFGPSRSAGMMAASLLGAKLQAPSSSAIAVRESNVLLDNSRGVAALNPSLLAPMLPPSMGRHGTTPPTSACPAVDAGLLGPKHADSPKVRHTQPSTAPGAARRRGHCLRGGQAPPARRR